MTARAHGRARIGRLAIIVPVVVSVVALAGCTPNPAPAEQPYPEVSWPDGEPSGPYEADAAVKATRDALVAMAVAANRNDFRLPELVDTVGYEVRTELWSAAEQRLQDGEATELSPGPLPFEVTSVTADGDGSRVRGCAFDDWTSADGAHPSTTPVTGSMSGREFRVVDVDGRLKVDAVIVAPQDDCSSASPARGFFSPEPVVSAVTDPADLQKPLTDEQSTAAPSAG
ncbi:hypothetical protein SAMN06295974_0126 [Plantibacter flavus]|uniref:Lipoprotein n=1 Tax=Plantibacter flavus TaxID=150123 RepID=A0A3N2C054_9MICO|nr:hypothetical protein [Plantibacter flavus]ROR80906.1 hypothetical protein EDD42_0953 [Plantibacter flavus]SMG06008.1 hypothetical protein SAMN06295974_0126 [Plantibacter flavus]